jgi:hypothetical protein
MATVLLAGTAAFLFFIALVVFLIGGWDRLMVSAVLAGLLSLSLSVLARFSAPRR